MIQGVGRISFVGWWFLARRAAPVKKAKTKPRSKQPKKVKFICKYVCSPTQIS